MAISRELHRIPLNVETLRFASYHVSTRPLLEQAVFSLLGRRPPDLRLLRTHRGALTQTFLLLNTFLCIFRPFRYELVLQVLQATLGTPSLSPAQIHNSV